MSSLARTPESACRGCDCAKLADETCQPQSRFSLDEASPQPTSFPATSRFPREEENKIIRLAAGNSKVIYKLFVRIAGVHTALDEDALRESASRTPEK